MSKMDNDLYMEWKPGNVSDELQSYEDERLSLLYLKKSECMKIILLNYQFCSQNDDDSDQEQDGEDDNLRFQLEFLKFSGTIFEYIDTHNKCLIHGRTC